MRALICLLLLSVSAFADSYIVRDKATKAILRTSSGPLTIDGKVPTGLDPAIEVLVVRDQTAPPEFDAATQKSVHSETEVAPVSAGFPRQILRGWTVTALTQAEIDARTAETANQTERTALKALVADLVAGTGTVAQRQARCERALARLIMDIYR